MVEEQVKDALLAIDEGELSRIARVADRLLAGHPIFTEGGSRRRLKSGRGTDFLDFRTYTPGDDLRQVDWRASARHPNLLVRRYHDEAAAQWYVCLDRSASMRAPDGEKWLLAVRIAAAFLYLLLHRSNRAGLLTFSDDIDGHCPAGHGRRQYRRTLSVLARTSPRAAGGGSRLQSCAKRLGRRSSAIVVSDFLTGDGMRGGLERIAGLGGRIHALQVLSDDECEAGSAGHTFLQDIESGERLAVDWTRGDPRQEARERMGRFQAELAGYCRKRDIAFTPCRSGQHWKSVVIDHLARACRDHA